MRLVFSGHVGNPANFCGVIIIIDPLLSDGEMLRDKLKDAEVNVTFKKYNGVTHEFFGMAAVVPEAKDAQSLAARELKNAFGASAKR